MRSYQDSEMSTTGAASMRKRRTPSEGSELYIDSQVLPLEEADEAAQVGGGESQDQEVDEVRSMGYYNQQVRSVNNLKKKKKNTNVSVNKKKKKPTKIAVRPVREPASTPAPLSM